MSRAIITLRNQQESPLLRLPTELRNKIYEYAVGGNTINIKGGILHVAALSQSCTQIRSEAGDLHLQLNVFSGKPKDLINFIERYGDRAQSVRTVKVDLTVDPATYLFFTGLEFISLEHILVEIPESEGVEEHILDAIKLCYRVNGSAKVTLSA